MDELGNMPHRFGREGPLDGITNLWALFGLPVAPEDMVFIVKTLVMETFGIIQILETEDMSRS